MMIDFIVYLLISDLFFLSYLIFLPLYLKLIKNEQFFRISNQFKYVLELKTTKKWRGVYVKNNFLNYELLVEVFSHLDLEKFVKIFTIIILLLNSLIVYSQFYFIHFMFLYL